MSSASFNKVLLIGRLTRDPENRQVGGGRPIVTFGLAVSRNVRSARGDVREEVCFVDVEAWNRTGEIVQQYCHKGSQLFVEGRLRFDQWDDRETGRKRSRLSVSADNVQLLDPVNRGGQQGAEDYAGGQDEAYPPQQPNYQQRSYVQPQQAMPDFQPMPDETLDSPF